jgi:hypothetical protein
MNFTAEDSERSALASSISANQADQDAASGNGQPEEFELIYAVTMDAFSIQLLRKFHNANRVEWTFSDTYSAPGAERFIDDGFFLSSDELDRVSSIQYLGAETIARYPTIIWFAVLFVQCGDA